MEKIRVDFNRRNGRGELITSVKRASGPISQSDLVHAFQPGEPDMDSTGEVVEVGQDGRVVIALLADSSYEPKSHGGVFWVVKQHTSNPAMSLPAHRPATSTLIPEPGPQRDRELALA